MIGALTLVAGGAAAALFATQSRGAQTDQHKELAQARTQVRTLRAQLATERRHHRRAVAHAGRAHARPSVDHALTIAAAAYGVPKARLRAVARCESTLVPTAQNGPYAGLFQFGAPLWSKTPYARFARTDPYAASLAAAWAFSRGMDRNWPVCAYR